jgi:hypothetical protein
MTKFITVAFALVLPLLSGCTGGDDKDSGTTDSAVVAE